MNKLQALQERNRLYKQQIRELQRALELSNTISRAFQYEAAYNRELVRAARQSDFLSKITQEQINKELAAHYTKFGYELVKRK